MTVIPIQLPAGLNTLQVLAKDRYGNPHTIASTDASRFTVDLRSTKEIENSTTSGAPQTEHPDYMTCGIKRPPLSLTLYTLCTHSHLMTGRAFHIIVG